VGESGEKYLKREVGFLGLLAACVGLNIGGALFALTTVAAGLCGPSLPLAMLVSALPMLLVVFPYVTLTSALPTTSASYRYAQLFDPRLALVSMLTLLLCILLGGQPLFAFAFGKYLAMLAPVDPIWAGVAVLVFFYVVNLVGVRTAAWVQTALFFLLLSALVLFIVGGIPWVRAEHFSDFLPKGVGGLLAASGLLFTFSAGGIFVVDLGGEVLEARKAFSRALPFGIGIVVVLYVLIGVITVGICDWRTLEGRSLLDVARRFLAGPVFAYFVVAGALVACATTINVIFAIISRGLLVVAEDGFLPSWLGRVNQRFGTPHWGLTVSWLVCTAALLANPSLLFFGSMLNLGLIFAITAVNMAGLVLPARYPELYERSLKPLSPGVLRAVCVAVVVLNSMIFIFFLAAVGWAAAVFLLIVAACSLFARSRRSLLARRKGDLAQPLSANAVILSWLGHRGEP
jgi:APA family basic amino acid/polyamine antiporter